MNVRQTPARVAIIGCGNISQRYVDGMRRFDELEVVGCADVLTSAAEGLGTRSGIHAYGSIDELLCDESIEIVVNITTPLAHAAVTEAALKAGKHVYVEKPMTAETDSARRLLNLAAGLGLLIGAAPDTFLGSAGQTARQVIDDGVIGTPIGASAFIRYSKAEAWHPDPSFLFAPGGGPALDLGPYFLTALVNLLGPVGSVSAFARIGAEKRQVTAPGRRVDEITVTTPTHTSASLQFVNGVIGTMIASFDIWDTELPFIEIYGDQGTLSIGDSNEYDVPVRVRRHDSAEWADVAPVCTPSGKPGSAEQLLRGVGVVDLARAVRGAEHRASGDLALHVLEVIEAIQISSDERAVVRIESAPGRPAAVVQTYGSNLISAS